MKKEDLKMLNLEIVQKLHLGLHQDFDEACRVFDVDSKKGELIKAMTFEQLKQVAEQFDAMIQPAKISLATWGTLLYGDASNIHLIQILADE